VPLRIGNITFDCDDVLKVARFWAGALGRTLDPASSPGFASLGGSDPDRAEPAWYFEKVPEQKKAKNRVHLDLVDPELSVEQLVALGASVLAEHAIASGQHQWTVMQDPEGNEFCVATKSFTG
jgi:hypothetical protein